MARRTIIGLLNFWRWLGRSLRGCWEMLDGWVMGVKLHDALNCFKWKRRCDTKIIMAIVHSNNQHFGY